MARLTAEQWEKVKADWCTGRYTYQQLSDSHNVSDAAIIKRKNLEGWQQLDPKVVDAFVSAKVKTQAEIEKVSKVSKVSATNLQKSLDVISENEYKGARNVGLLLDAIPGMIPLCESPQHLKFLAEANKVAVETGKDSITTAIQFNQTTEQQPKTLKLEVVRVEN